MNITDKLEHIATNIVKLIFFAIIAYLFYYSIVETSAIIENKYTNEHTLFRKDNIILNITAIISVCIISVIIRKRRIKINKYVVFIITILWIATCVTWIFMTDLTPRSDQLQTLKVASKILQGNYAPLKKGGYLYIYPQQYGLTLYFCAIVSLFNESAYLIIQLINIFLLCIAYYSIYKIIQLLYNNEKISKCVFLALIAFAPISMYITFVYGNIIGLTFSCLSILFQIKYLQSEKKRYILPIAVFACLAVMLKSNYLINLVGILVVFIVEMIFRKKIKYIIPIISIIVCYIGMTHGVNYIMKSITGMERSEGTPMTTWVAMGMQEGPMAPGWYNEFNLNTYVKSGYDSDKASVKAQDSIQKSIEEFKNKPEYAREFFNKKILSQWNNPTFECIWIHLYRKTEQSYSPMVESVLIKDGKLGKLITGYADTMQSLILFGTCTYIILDFKKIKMKELIFAIIFIGGFLFHIVWEAKCQYAITYFVLLIPYSVLGYYKIGGKINKILKLRRKNA